MIAVAGALTPERSFRHQDFRGDCVCSKEPEPVLFENRRDALEQIIVTAADDAEDSRTRPRGASGRFLSRGLISQIAGRTIDPMKITSRQPSRRASRQNVPNWPR